ncbi:chalcone synthase [Bacillus coahuilensis p1.1.43]|uniref:Chalcone synthase n=1 Tax=Bacillus coahuilensis p1.1.43 TaxID=1150625 RepID=A0A147K8K2_9BACI|nr:3-oxoacyl-[acyl-carrier-protein] synthase III C-terminal domain-containing protein [Bacillus coahuilensis]KUP06523.1 chalcone synthase [Bacillus coahuilensis p1.1.43]
MGKIIGVETATLHHVLSQSKIEEFAGQLFSSSFRDISRLLKIFTNGGIETRYFVNDLEWYGVPHTFEEKNRQFITSSIQYGVEAIQKIIHKHNVKYDDIDAIFTICTTGLATPSIEARIMNLLPFGEHTKRIPIWGLGCAGGTAGLNRAFDYCKAYPDKNVLVLTIELCSLTFQYNDRSKSNLVGTSLFADGVACALVSGNKSSLVRKGDVYPTIVASQSTLMKNSIDVMGWDIQNDGLHVIFSRDIPSVVESWFKPNVMKFLKGNDLTLDQLDHFIAHPGGKKVIHAYQSSLGLSEGKLEPTWKILRKYGNMSSATILFVLKEFIEKKTVKMGDIGLGVALGPGFSSELSLMRWE